MRKFKLTLLLAAVMFSLVFSIIFTSTNAAQVEGDFEITKELEALKDETVYAVLNHDGTVDSVYVVNYLSTPETAVYVDYGDYTNVENLTNEVKPVIADGKIKWDLKQSFEGFYFKGALQERYLPWDIGISYKLNGVELPADALAGKSGEIEISITVRPDENAAQYFKDNFTIQLQLPVNMDKSKVISSEGAVKIISGKTTMLTYTLLPGSKEGFNVLLQAKDFEMDSISIAIVKAEYSIADVSEIEAGFKSLKEGVNDLISGTVRLRDGMSALKEGIVGAAEGQNELTSKGNTLAKGMSDFNSGLREYTSSAASIYTASSSMYDALDKTAQNGKAIAAGYEKSTSALKEKLPEESDKAQLKALAQYSGSPDPAYSQLGKMAEAMLNQISALEELYGSLNMLNSNLEQYAEGVELIAGSYKELHNGIGSFTSAPKELLKQHELILEGNKEFLAGLSSVNSGMSELSSKAANIPDEVQRLINGQRKILDGVSKAEDTLSAVTASNNKKPMSFASPDKASAESVQFILRTQSIASGGKKTEAAEVKGEKKGFFERLLSLFR